MCFTGCQKVDTKGVDLFLLSILINIGEQVKE